MRCSNVAESAAAVHFSIAALRLELDKLLELRSDLRRFSAEECSVSIAAGKVAESISELRRALEGMR